MIKLIEKQQHIFYMQVHGCRCTWIPPCFLVNDESVRLKAMVKGSTLGWYVNRKWVSYNQLKAAVKNINSPILKIKEKNNQTRHYRPHWPRLCGAGCAKQQPENHKL